MKIAALCPTMNVHGGVRTYYELGNELIRQGHTYTLFTNKHKEQVPFMEFKGEIKPYTQHSNDRFDMVLTGAQECLNDLENVNASIKVVLIVAKFYDHEYKKLWNR
jgi:hypothetical protein